MKLRIVIGLVLAFTMVLGIGCEDGTVTDTETVQQAIVGGELDGDAHPYVGIVVFSDDWGPLWRCSGALIAPDVFLTAGHCAGPQMMSWGEAVANSAMIWFDSDATGTGYPWEGGVTGVPFWPEDYDYASELPPHGPDNRWDIGVVVLDEPVEMPRYGFIADLGRVDELGAQDQLLDVVGYGLQAGWPSYEGDRQRRQTSIKFSNTEDVLSGGYFIKAAEANHGTCLGDSGGPVMIAGTDEIVGIVSFGLAKTCHGVGYHYRTDTIEAQDFLAGYGYEF